MDFFRRQDWDIVGRTRLWFLISGIAIICGLVAWGVFGLNYGIDFTGGSLLRYSFATPLADTDAGVPAVLGTVRGILGEMGLAGSQIQVVGDERGELTGLYMRTPAVANDEEAARRDTEIVAALKTAFADRGEISDLGRETVGPVVGKELRNKALLALIIGCLLILVYISIRYEFRFAVAGIVALIHDTLIVLGCMAIFQVELNSGFVAAILTVLGYSINDSVIIFDRIRENMRLHRRADFGGTVNTSLLQTMARSVNTMLTTLFVLIALFVFGGGAISGFALALIFGVTTGCYSSIFVASPIVVLWEGKAARDRAQAAATRTGRRGTQRGRGAALTSEEPESLAEGASAEGSESREVIERLQRQEMDKRKRKVDEKADERKRQVDEEAEVKREERRDRRKREKTRTDKKGGKKRF